MVNQPDLSGLDSPRVWDTESAGKYLSALGKAGTKRDTDSHLRALRILPDAVTPKTLADERKRPVNQLLLDWAIDKSHVQAKLVLFAQLHHLPTGNPCLHVNDTYGRQYWLPLELSAELEPGQPITTGNILKGLTSLQAYFNQDLAIFPHGDLVGLLRQTDDMDHISLFPSVYQPVLHLQGQGATGEGKGDGNKASDSNYSSRAHRPTPHLKHLEAESIHIIREAVAEAENPVLLYSIGKDSSALLHLIRKAFYPSPPPLPLLHVDTCWKFQEMYLFRDHMAKESGMKLLLHTNPDVIARDINPFDHDTDIYINAAKIEGLKQAIDHYKFDVLFGGARRDEEKSRAKERIFSFRTATHRWDPKQQRPELWNLYNTKKNKGESIRVFPLSNWTELDIWQYIYLEQIPVVPLYFAKKRPVVNRNGSLIMIDDDRFRLAQGETIEEKVVRFRSLGCYLLTGAIESSASNVQEIIMELLSARKSERQGRVVDHDSPYSMEKKKQEGHF